MDPITHARLLLAVGAVFAAQPLGAQTSLSISSLPAYPGVTVSVPAMMAAVTNVVAAQFDVAFDPTRVTSGAALSPPSSRHTVISREVAPGVRRVLVFSRQNSVITNRNAANLPFTLLPAEHIGSGPLSPGNATLATADATAVTPLTLNSGTLFARPVNLLPNGHVQFFLPSTPEQRYIIQASADLENWTNISTNVATGSFLDVVDVDASHYPYRFYRWQAAE